MYLLVYTHTTWNALPSASGLAASAGPSCSWFLLLAPGRCLSFTSFPLLYTGAPQARGAMCLLTSLP